MSDIGKSERRTHNRVIALFRDTLDYRYLGDWTQRENNRNVKESLLRAWSEKRKHADLRARFVASRKRRRMRAAGELSTTCLARTTAKCDTLHRQIREAHLPKIVLHPA